MNHRKTNQVYLRRLYCIELNVLNCQTLLRIYNLRYDITPHGKVCCAFDVYGDCFQWAFLLHRTQLFPTQLKEGEGSSTVTLIKAFSLEYIFLMRFKNAGVCHASDIFKYMCFKNKNNILRTFYCK